MASRYAACSSSTPRVTSVIRSSMTSRSGARPRRPCASIQALQTGGLCRAEWRPGDENLEGSIAGRSYSCRRPVTDGDAGTLAVQKCRLELALLCRICPARPSGSRQTTDEALTPEGATDPRPLLVSELRALQGEAARPGRIAQSHGGRAPAVVAIHMPRYPAEPTSQPSVKPRRSTA